MLVLVRPVSVKISHESQAINRDDLLLLFCGLKKITYFSISAVFLVFFELLGGAKNSIVGHSCFYWAGAQ